MTTLEYTESLTVTHCWCGIAVGIPQNLYRQAYDHGKSVYCPLGHSFSWNETQADKERKKRERAEEEAQRLRQRLTAERDLRHDTERRLSAQKGATTRARKRHAAGVCPCCQRTFQNVVRHMESQHPDFDPAKPAS